MKVIEIFDFKLKKLISEEKFNKIDKEEKEYILAYAKSKIMVYCHRRDIPKEAYYVWADIAIELLKNIDKPLFEVDTTSEEELAKRITSVRAGDTTIAIDAGSGSDEIDTGYKDNVSDDAILTSFAKQLQAFRKVPAGCGVDLHGV